MRSRLFPAVLSSLAVFLWTGCGERLSGLHPLLSDPAAGFVLPQPSPTPFPPCTGCLAYADMNAPGFSTNGGGAIVAYDDSQDCPGSGSSASVAELTGGWDGSDYARLNYSVGSVSTACGFYTLIVFLTGSNNDISAYSKMRFRYKTGLDGQLFRVQLVSMGPAPAGTVRRSVAIESYSQPKAAWQEVIVPLSAFSGINPGGMSSVEFLAVLSGQTGTLDIDDVRFEP